MFFYTKLTSIKELRPGHPEAGGVGKLTVERGKGGKKLWDAGKMKKCVRPLAAVVKKQSVKKNATAFFSFTSSIAFSVLPSLGPAICSLPYHSYTVRYIPTGARIQVI